VTGEDDALADLGLDHEVVAALDEELLQPLGRDLGGDGLGEDPGAGDLDVLRLDIGGEQLEVRPAARLLERLGEEDGQ
jgi:hypothetical protein